MTETVFDNIAPAVLERVKRLRLIDDELDVVAEDIFKTEYNIEIQRDGSGANGRIYSKEADLYTL